MPIWQNVFAFVGIPETGQIQSFVSGDNGEIKSGKLWPTQRFSDNLDGTLTDNLTGLMWLKDADCSTEISSGAAALQWTTALSFANDLNAGILNHRCSAYNKNYTDWHVPNINEIGSLMRAGLSNKTIANWLNIPDNNSAGFSQTNLIANPIWTSTTYAMDTNKVWAANLEFGGTEPINKSNINLSVYIFSAVRNSKLPNKTNILPTGQQQTFQDGDDGYWQNRNLIPGPRYIKTDTGTVIDKLTRLTWIADANCANPSGSNWSDAVYSAYYSTNNAPFFNNCTSYSETNDEKKQTWRLPNINELKTLINYGQANPAIESSHPFNITSDLLFWSSTSANGANADISAWSVDFNNGQISAATNKNTFGYTWPVSGPIDFPDITSDATSISFGSIFSNSESSNETTTLTNNGTMPLTIQSIISTDPHFTVQPNLCNTTLEPLDSCEVSIFFAPSESREYNASLVIASNALGLEEYQITLLATGLTTKKEESNPNCFIATAAYGSYLNDEVSLLRSFRDSYLLNSTTGKQFVNFYYKTSPPIAKIIEQNQSLRFLTRILLTPIIYAIKYPALAIISLTILLVFFLNLIYKRIGYNEAFCRILRTK